MSPENKLAETSDQAKSKPQIALYGSWSTPFTSQVIVEQTVGYTTIMLDGEDIYWVETRPKEGGRHVIVKRDSEGNIIDITPPGYNARTLAHEYGGGAYSVHEGTVYFSQYTDQRLYKQVPGQKPECLNTPEGMRFAETTYDTKLNRLIAVCEDHRTPDQEATNSIVSIALDGSGQVIILASGADFYHMPKISPDGQKLAWLCWNHPNMPWDGTKLYTANIAEDGSLEGAIHVAGSEQESVVQPEWSPDGQLYFVSDRTGFWNIYRQIENGTDCVHTSEVEFCRPAWIFGNSSYCFVSSDQIICSYNQKGFWHLGLIDTRGKLLSEICVGFTDIWWLKVSDRKAIFVGASPSHPQSVVHVDIDAHKVEIIAKSTNLELDPEMISIPEPIEFPSANGRTAHALYYKPKNKSYKAPDGELPPLLVKAHGGPTGTASTMLNFEFQYWTSRGFAVLDVNYGGSTGYGREYQERLTKSWGIVDVEDCVSGAQYLVNQGLVDGNRLAISGRSAGGYTVLCALTFKDIFKAGASYYGIGDMEAMAKDTHKFESRYCDKLVGLYPQERDVYIARSPIHHVDQLSCPIIFFQGLEDKVVPPNQTEMMVNALRKKKIPVSCIMFEGEQHGFRKSETIKRCLDAELYFYSRIFGFNVSDNIVPIEIENM